ncbi:MAG: O-antigen ligase family protein [Chloroflexota bacterium]|nr:O-antigen ligase family protein [Chloroflexota bacterium]MDQ5864729.1 O-antigen ligase family protein [Chloroflexota bacterium]
MRGIHLHLITDNPRFRTASVGLFALVVALAVNLLPPLVVLGVVAGVVGLVLFLRRPVWAVYALVLSVPAQDVVTVGSITATRVVFVVTLGIWWMWLALRDDRRFQLTPIGVAVIFYLIATLPSLGAASSISESLTELGRWGVTLVAFILIVNSVQTRKEMNGLIVVMLVAGVFEAALGLVQAYGGIGPVSFNVAGGLTRAYGTIGMPNSFAGYLNMSLPLALALVVYQWGKWASARKVAPYQDRLSFVSVDRLKAPIGMTLVTATLFWTLLTTLSRGAWVGLTFGLLAMGLALGRRASAALGVLLAVSVALLVLGVAGALPTPVTDRFGQLVGQLTIFDPRGVVPTPDNYNVVSRMVHWQTAGNMFLESPWVGVGIGNYNVLFVRFGVQGWPYSSGHAHNYYLHTLAETGLVGTTFYVAMLITALVVGVRALLSARAAGDTYGEAVVIGALGILVTFMFHNFFENLHVLNMGIHWGAALALFTLSKKL